MGGSTSKFITESDMSDSDTESAATRTNDERTDAALRINSNPSIKNILTIEKVQEFETQLDTYEIVSLVFLLYDVAELALQTLIVFLASHNKDILSQWAMSQNDKNKWQEKLIEALCIIQNYEILRTMGLNKEYLKATYLPRRAQICNSIKKRKVLYLLAENMDDETTFLFLQKMETKLKDLNIPFQKFNHNYLELYFLDWEQSRFNFSHMKSVFKSMDLDDAFDIVEEFFPTETAMPNPVLPTIAMKQTKPKLPEGLAAASTTRDTTYKFQSISASTSSGYSGLSSLLPSLNMYQWDDKSQQIQDNSIIESNLKDPDRYCINPDKPGVVLIINQENFYTEFDEQYKHLLHESHLQLETRKGTQHDKKRLMKTFERFGFEVQVEKNLSHFDLIDTVKQTALSITDESSLIVCILSHGENGVIFGANSCKVDVKQIEKILCKINKKLVGKPKVLILQSCQGKECQQVDQSDDELDDAGYARDGPSVMTDLLTFWATIPGYAAIRNIKKGSWFIQTLCDELEKNAAKYHLMDICTKVVNNVSDKSWKEENNINVMTPMLVSTFRKSFYLPDLKNM